MSQFDRRFQLATDRGSLGLGCTSDGVSLAGVPLVRKTIDGFKSRSAGEIDALIKAAFGSDIDPAALSPGLAVVIEGGRLYDEAAPRNHPQLLQGRVIVEVLKRNCRIVKLIKMTAFASR